MGVFFSSLTILIVLDWQNKAQKSTEDNVVMQSGAYIDLIIINLLLLSPWVHIVVFVIQKAVDESGDVGDEMDTNEEEASGEIIDMMCDFNAAAEPDDAD